jgi:hypothetical protein
MMKDTSQGICACYQACQSTCDITTAVSKDSLALEQAKQQFGLNGVFGSPRSLIAP